MLTLRKQETNFTPPMQTRKLKWIVSLFAIWTLQSCYTLIYPPSTLPQTVTTVVSEPAMASTVGGTGAYGWDPYWEPTLPFTSYSRGYGASYYSPYNYYDYQHPHYAPVYVVSETRDIAPSRDFGRDQKQGGGREREMNGASVPSNSGSKSTGTGQSSSMSTAAPGIISPAIPPPVVKAPQKSKSKSPTKVVAQPPKREIKPIKIKTPKAVKQSKEADQKSPPPPAKKKRARTRK